MIADGRIETYLTAYGDSLAQSDAEQSAALWGVPGMTLGDAGAIVVDDRAQMVAGPQQGSPVYRRLGLAAVDHELLDVHRLTDRIVRLRVRWIFLDADGGELTDGTYVYVLRQDDDGALRAHVSISIDAEEKLAALAAAKGVEL